MFLSIYMDWTVINIIQMIYNIFAKEFDLSFANGGDQSNENIPERFIFD